MSDIFVSYDSRDLKRVKPFVDELVRRNWSVWWDRSLLPGQRWEKVIETEIGKAKCLVVLWSHHSIESDWVHDEADEGRHRGILVPVLLDEVKLPMGSRGIQAARMVDWPDTPRDSLEAICRVISAMLNSSIDRSAFGSSVFPVAARPATSEIPEISFTTIIEQSLRPIPPERPHFEMAAYLVTNRDYYQFLQDPASEDWKPNGTAIRDGLVDDQYLRHWLSDRFHLRDARVPVVNVSWLAASAYVRWLGNQVRRSLRLPSDREWGIAARAGCSIDLWWRSAERTGLVNCKGREDGPSRVGTFGANAFGLADLLGNVYEFCESDGNRVVGLGGAFYSAVDQLVRPIILKTHQCRPDTGFRFVADVRS